MIRAALHLAHSSGNEQAENQARELLARLAADTFQLAVAGQFSRGKTTLMNALLGGPYLPMGALPMTSVITRVRYGSRRRRSCAAGHRAWAWRCRSLRWPGTSRRPALRGQSSRSPQFR
jgi:hypothetical protein